MKLRQTTDEYTVPTEFYTPAGEYSDAAGPDPDARREQLDQPELPARKVEPEPDETTDELPADESPVPYTQPTPPPARPAEPERPPSDGVTLTRTIGDDPVVILSEDGRRRSWTVWVNDASSAGVRLSLGRHARENADNTSTSIPLAAGEVLDGHSAATIAVVTDTPGTVALVHLVAELDGIN